MGTHCWWTLAAVKCKSLSIKNQIVFVFLFRGSQILCLLVSFSESAVH